MTSEIAFPLPRRCPMLPPEEYDELRSERPVAPVTLPGGRRAWLVTRHAAIRQVLSAPAVSSDMAHPGYPLQFEAPAHVLEQIKPTLLAEDPPVHTEQRRLIAGEFTARRLDLLRPRIAEIVAGQLDTFLANGSPGDLVAGFAVPVPALVICELLGVPAEDREEFGRRAQQLIALDVPPGEREQARAELLGYLDELVAVKERDGAEDLLGRLVRRNAVERVLTRAQIVGIANVLLVGGHETTANMIALGALGLLENPDQLAVLREDPGSAPQVVDELLRFFSIGDQVAARAVLSDIEVDGVRIPAGDGVITLTASGNHDDAVYDRPHEIDVRRDSRRHLAFGHGIHQCIGQNLARIELQIALTTLLSRIPALRSSVPVDRLRFKNPYGVYGLHEFPVEW